MELHCKQIWLLVLVLLAATAANARDEKELSQRRLRRAPVNIYEVTPDDSSSSNNNNNINDNVDSEFGTRGLKYMKSGLKYMKTEKYEKEAKSGKSTKVYEKKYAKVTESKYAKESKVDEALKNFKATKNVRQVALEGAMSMELTIGMSMSM